MAQYAVLIYSSGSDRGEDAAPEEREVNDRHAEQLAASGSMLLAYALTPRELATSIRSTGITDGPFVEAKEVVAGFYVIEAEDLDAALAIAGANPAVAAGGGVEVRPVDSGGVIEQA
jgi:hypothetical protein